MSVSIALFFLEHDKSLIFESDSKNIRTKLKKKKKVVLKIYGLKDWVRAERGIEADWKSRTRLI